MAPTPEASERITHKVFALLADLIKELHAEGDQDGLQALPPVILTTGVIALSQSLTPEIVAHVLESLKVRVECGEFSGMKIPMSPVAAEER